MSLFKTNSAVYVPSRKMREMLSGEIASIVSNAKNKVVAVAVLCSEEIAGVRNIKYLPPLKNAQKTIYYHYNPARSDLAARHSILVENGDVGALLKEISGYVDLVSCPILFGRTVHVDIAAKKCENEYGMTRTRTVFAEFPFADSDDENSADSDEHDGPLSY